MALKTLLLGVALLAATETFAIDSGIAEKASMNLKEGVNYEVLTFPRGSTKLSAAQKRQLKSLADASGADIEDVHVAVWSDQSFPKNA
ncbi:MAG: hypothetical protein V4760_12800, partial [Bdellovibrionota bacterium]